MLTEHTLCDQNRVVQFYQINNGGHTWPGGSWPGSAWPGFLGHVNRDINASGVILRFFEAHQKTVTQSGRVEERFVMHEDSLRRYLLYIPDSYDGTSDWPLVLNYHGLLTNSEFQAEVSQMNQAADVMQFLVAYPQGLDVVFPNFPVGPGWNAPGFTADHDDLSFTDTILDDINANFQINSERIHSTGWSNGSIMSFLLACERADVIASVAGVAASMTPEQMAECQFTRPISTMYIQGTEDPIVPYEGTVDLTPAESTVEFFVDAFACADPITTDLPDIVPEDSSTVTFLEYSGCNENVEVHFYRVNNGGHTWPQGGSPQAAAPLGFKNEDFNANLAILEFFSDNPLSETATSTDRVDLPEISMTVYPNPFAGEVTIDFQLAKAENVEMVLYNAIGQEVQTIASQVYLPGKQSIKWKSQDSALPAGLYFLRLKAGKQQLTRSLLHLKR